MSKKNNIFAPKNDDDYEPSALATDSGRGIPILTGKAAKRFLRMAEENERKAAEKAKKPMTLEEAEKQLSYEKMFLSIKENELKEIKDRIKKLENYISTVNG